MAGISTEYLAEQIEASNERLTKAIEDLTRKVDEGQKELSDRLTKATEDLTRKLEEGRKEFIAFRLDVTDKLSAIRTSMGWIKGLTALVIVPAALAVAAFSYKATDRAARLEESIIALRDHAREQDARISRLIEFHRQGAKNEPSQSFEKGNID